MIKHSYGISADQFLMNNTRCKVARVTCSDWKKQSTAVIFADLRMFFKYVLFLARNVRSCLEKDNISYLEKGTHTKSLKLQTISKGSFQPLSSDFQIPEVQVKNLFILPQCPYSPTLSNKCPVKGALCDFFSV